MIENLDGQELNFTSGAPVDVLVIVVHSMIQNKYLRMESLACIGKNQISRLGPLKQNLILKLLMVSDYSEQG